MRPGEEFEPLRIQKKHLLDSDKCRYRVYKTPIEFVTVEAATALQAIAESGIARPARVVRELRFMERLMDNQRIVGGEEFVETCELEMGQPEIIQPHQEAVPSTAAEPAAPQRQNAASAASFAKLPLRSAPAPAASTPTPSAETTPRAEAMASPAIDGGGEDWEDALIAEGDAKRAEAPQLSADEVQHLLGDKSAQVEEAKVEEESPLSPDEIAKLLDND